MQKGIKHVSDTHGRSLVVAAAAMTD